LPTCWKNRRTTLVIACGRSCATSKDVLTAAQQLAQRCLKGGTSGHLLLEAQLGPGKPRCRQTRALGCVSCEQGISRPCRSDGCCMNATSDPPQRPCRRKLNYPEGHFEFAKAGIVSSSRNVAKPDFEEYAKDRYHRQDLW
jgi:hypothetical protein